MSASASSGEDLAGSFDYGKKKNDKNHCGTVDICLDLLFATLATALAGAFLALFTAITMNGKKRRKRRELEQAEGGIAAATSTWWDAATDLYWIGCFCFALYFFNIYTTTPCLTPLSLCARL